MLNLKTTREGGSLTPFKAIWPTIDHTAFVFPGAQVNGDVHIGAGSSIWHNTVIRGDVNYIRIGKKTNVQDGTVIHVSTNTFPTIIGDNVLVAHGCMLHGAILKDNSFVGMNSTVMDGATVESDGMLAAGSLLTPGKTVKSGELWAGSPAKFIRSLTKQEIDKNRFMADHYRKLAEQHSYDLRGEDNPEPYPTAAETYRA